MIADAPSDLIWIAVIGAEKKENSHQMKKILIVSYMFPPISGGGTMRPLKYVKYLPDCEIQPVVFCPRNAQWKAYDHTNLDLPFLKKTTVYRCGIRRLQRYYHLRYTSGRRKHPLFYLLAVKYFCFLDFFSAWYFECRQNLFDIAKREKAACVFTTSPPHSTHMFGHYLKRTLQIPWIMDIRDAMAIDPNRRLSPLVRLQASLEYRYEKKFYGSADAIISVSDPIVHSIRQRHARLHLDAKTHTITNGYDEDDFAVGGLRTKEKRQFVVTYTGSFMGRQSPEFFLKAVQSAIDRQSVQKDDIRIRFIGHYDEHIRFIMKRYQDRFPLEIVPFQPYAEALRYQLQSDLLLLIVNIEAHEGGAQTMTGKFFEYLGAARPILALVPEGPLKETIIKGHFGVVTPPRDVPSIASAFIRLYREWKATGGLTFQPDIKLRGTFTRRQLTGKLADIIHSIT